MKKILVIIILLIAFWRIDCEASSYYTDYYLVNEQVNEYREENDLLKREEIITYNNYYFKKINQDYYQEGMNPDTAPYIDYNDYHEEDIITLDFSNDITTQHIALMTSSTHKIQYIKVSRIEAPDNILQNIKVYNNDEPIDFSFTYYHDEAGIIAPFTLIDLKSSYSIVDIMLELDIESNNDYSFLINIDYYSDLELKFNRYSLSYFINKSVGNNKCFFSLMKNDDFNALKSAIAPERSDIYDRMTYYKIDMPDLYLYYNLEKTYLDEYTKIPLESYYHDENDSMTFYNYYQRDLIILKDQITSIEEQLITYTSLKETDFIIEGDIDLQQNGEYEIKIIIDENNFFTHQVIVNILAVEEPITETDSEDNSPDEENSPVEEESTENENNDDKKEEPITETETEGNSPNEENLPVEEESTENENNNDNKEELITETETEDNSPNEETVENEKNILEVDSSNLEQDKVSNEKIKTNNKISDSISGNIPSETLLPIHNQSESSEELLAFNNIIDDNLTSSSNLKNSKNLLTIIFSTAAIVLSMLLFIKQKKKN